MRGAENLEKMQLYLAFGRSTTPIPGKGCAWRRHVGKNVQLYRGRTQEREVKLHLFPTVWRDASKITMDWRGRATVNAR